MADLFKEKWDIFCENLKDVGSIIESESSLSETDQAEGYRYLLRLMRLSLEAVEILTPAPHSRIALAAS